jgi:hypothetical protein
MRRPSAVLSFLLLLCVASCVHRPVGGSRSIVGTWRLVEFWDQDEPHYPYGNPPAGIWVYDKAGNVSVQISLNPPLPNLPAEGYQNQPQQVLVQTLNAYMAYFGTYTVDWENGQIIHDVQSDVLRAYTGTRQPRPFRLEGNRLIIGDGKTWRRVLERISD